MANTAYITAGLPVSKDESVVPGAGINTAYPTAGLPPAVIAAGAGIEGVLSATLDGITRSAAAKVAVAGAAAKTLEAIGLSAAGTVAISAAAAKTLDAIGLSAASGVLVTAEAAKTLDDLAVSAAGKALVKAVAAGTLDALVATATGKVLVEGVATIALGAIALTAAGLVAVEAAAAGTLEGIGLSAAGAVLIQGAAAPTLAGIGLSASAATGTYRPVYRIHRRPFPRRPGGRAWLAGAALHPRTPPAGGDGAARPAGRRGDALRLELAGVELRGLRAVGAIPGTLVLAAGGANGTGTGRLRSWGDGTFLSWQAPGSATPGPEALIPSDGDWILEDGEDRAKWIRLRVWTASLVAGPAEALVRLQDRYGAGVAADDQAAADVPGLVTADLSALTDSRVTLVRASAATRINRARTAIDNVAANLPRRETVATAGAITLTKYATPGIALCVDSIRRVWFYTEANTPTTTITQVDADGDETEVVDIAASGDVLQDFYDAFPGEVNVASMRVSENGDWLLWLGRNGTYDGDDQCRVYCRRGGAGAWVLIHSNIYGSVSASGVGEPKNNVVLWGDYAPIVTTNKCGYHVWRIDCSGETVVVDRIYDRPDPDVIQRHVHHVCEHPTDPLECYAAYGDVGDHGAATSGPWFIELAGPAGWEAGDSPAGESLWTATVIWAGQWTTTDTGFNVQCERMAAVGTKILVAGYANLWYDPSTGALSHGPWFPPKLAGVNFAYGHQGDHGANVSMSPWVHEGVLYLCVYSYTVANENDGLYASADEGLTWTALYRQPAGDGFDHILGVVGGRLIIAGESVAGAGEIWRSDCVPTVRAIEALRLEAAVTNVITDAVDGTFAVGSGAGATGHWQVYAGHDTAVLTGVAGGMDGAAMQVAITAKGGAETYCRLLLQKQAAWPTFASGTKFVLRMKVKAVGAWPQNYKVAIYAYSSTTITWDPWSSREIIPCAGGWTDVTVEGRATGAGSTVLWLAIECDRAAGTDNANRTFLVDCVEIVPAAGAWRACDSYVAAGTPRADEYAEVPLADVAADDWKVAFSWRPEMGWSETAADLAIASIAGAGGTWMDLIWDQSAKTFTLTDNGSHTAASAVVEWGHFDEIRFEIASDGTDTTLTIREPVGGTRVVDCTAVAIGAPATMRFGTNHDASLFSAGHFTDDRRRAWELTVANDSPQTVSAIRAWMTETENVELSLDGESWGTYTTEAGALSVPDLAAGAAASLHVRRTVPAGRASDPRILNRLCLRYDGL